jgi:hypothetical protein
MPPSVEDRLRDVLEAIVGIDETLAGISLDQFDNDKVLRLATERYPAHHSDSLAALEIVCRTSYSRHRQMNAKAPITLIAAQ